MKYIAQIGTFDVENFGDLLFPFVLEKKMGNEYKIDLFSPNGGKLCFTNKKVYPISTFESKCRKNDYDAVIIGGGDVIRTDKEIFITSEFYQMSVIPSLQLWLFPIIIAKKYNIPVIFNSVGVPNDFKFEEFSLIKQILNKVDYLVVRDSEAKKALESIGLNNIKIVPDSVIAISDVISENELDVVYRNLIKTKRIPQIDDYIVFQHNSRFISDKTYYDKLISCIRYVSDKQKILLMPIGYIHDDDKVLKQIYNEKIKNVSIVNLKHKLTPLEMIAILNHSRGYIGTSMHGAVVSYSYNKPILILNMMNSKKLHGFAKISNNYECDVNNIDDFCFIYDNFFNKNKKSNLIENKQSINANFDKIKKTINSNKKSNTNFDLIDFILGLYKENDIIGSYCNNLNRLLDRNIIKWSKNGEFYEYKTNLKEFYLNISTQKNIIINSYNFEILDEKYYKFDNKILILKNTYLHVKTKDKKIKCKIEIIDDDSMANIIASTYTHR